MISFTADPRHPAPAELTARAAELWRNLPGQPMTGWLEPASLPELPELPAAEVVVVIGIGGSFLGAKAIYQALQPTNGRELIFSGTSFSERDYQAAVRQLRGRDFLLNVISKSGGTRETALGLDFWRRELADRYGPEAANRRILATTGTSGVLRDEATKQGWPIYDLPEDIGGRYSVFSPVGLLPLALAGVDTAALLRGAARDNHTLAQQFAAYRAHLAQHNSIEVLADFEPSLATLGGWWQQLFGESEGKDGRGLFPAHLTYSTDLHSMGQYLQQGRRNIIETLLVVGEPKDDQLAELSRAQAAVIGAVETAHRAGGVPVAKIELDTLDAAGLGELMMFFLESCALSALLQGLNPFDQPGVEAYKAEMQKML